MSITVRKATPADLDRIADLWVELNDYHHALDPRFWNAAPDGRERFREWIEQRLSNPECSVMVAEKGALIIGFVSGELRKSTPAMLPVLRGFVDSLGVAGNERSTGAGTSLMSAIEAWFVEQGASEVSLAVAKKNQGALNFYQRGGYEHWMSTMWKSLR